MMRRRRSGPDSYRGIDVYVSDDANALLAATEFMQDGGDAGLRLRAIDWSGSSLGDPAGWPHSLKAAIGLLLPSRARICLFWGPDLIAFYNDGYGVAIGENHPAALGRPAREGWSALWDVLEPLLRGVMRTGEGFEEGSHLFAQERHGFVKHTYFDISYNPVRGAEGLVEGVFCIVSEQTKRIVDERRLNTLRVLSLRQGIGTADEAARSFVEVLSDTGLADTPCSMVYLRRHDGTLRFVAGHGGEPEPDLLEVQPLGDPLVDFRLAALERVGRTGLVETLDGYVLTNPPVDAANRLVLLPLHAGREITGVLVTTENRHVQPGPDYRRFFELLAAGLSASLSAARALAEERDRIAALEQQVAAALSERATAEAKLRQAQKMEAIGRLTGGVAHDFNNLLQVVGGNLELLSRDVAGNEHAERRIGNALAGVARGARLSSQLLALSRKQTPAPASRVVHIERLVTGLDDMLRRSLGEAIEIRTTIGDRIWNVLIDPAQLENALLNLAINARDAMEEHGENRHQLTIQVDNAWFDDGYAQLHPGVTAGHYVMVSVTDTGCGMTPEIMEQVFEPFFSTKKEGRGTGLGLSMVHGFVEQSGGHIRIHSEPGHGTTIRLYLPRTMQAKDTDISIPTGPVQGGNETILVVEDDDGVRDTVIAMLDELGYRVLKAKDAAGALSVIESGMRVDLLFTDVIMPGWLRGPELARKARERIPGLPVLFTSGYTDDAIVQGGQLDAGVGLLAKPYTREALANTLRQVLPTHETSDRDAPGSTTILRLLLVEDDSLIRDNSAELLSEDGHVVTQAASAETAIEALEQAPVDVLITDLGLPGINGLELARIAQRRWPTLGLVFATGDDTVDIPVSGPLAEAVLLRKPYDRKSLVTAIATASAVRRSMP
ncbi:MAG: response regulator [Janthinobacterium lividum]